MADIKQIDQQSQQNIYSTATDRRRYRPEKHTQRQRQAILIGNLSIGR